MLPNQVSSTFSIQFASPVSAAAFYLVTDGAGTSIVASLNGTTVDSTSAGAYPGQPDYFGFTDSNFDTITLSVSGDGAALIDNLQFNANAVPEPASMALLGTTLFGAGMVRRRCKSV